MKRTLYSLLLLGLLAACAPTVDPGAVTSTEPTETSEPPQLIGTTWQLQSLQEAGGAQVELHDQVYTLTFEPDGSLGAQLDCNSGGGSYTLDGESLAFGPVISTLMFCSEQSVASNFGVALARVERFDFAGEELILSGEDGTSLRFLPQPAGD